MTEAWPIRHSTGSQPSDRFGDIFAHNDKRIDGTAERMRLDETDQRLIELLRGDSRLPAATLARILGVARGTVQNRIDRLVRERIIRGFTLRLSAEAEANIVRAVTAIEIRAGDTRAVVAALKGIPAAVAIHSTNGRWDLVVDISTTDLASLDRVISHIREIPGVTHSETSILLNEL
jgi:DNA-binding Lrp family transcriptional regulator